MAFNTAVDEVDFLLASLPWREEGRKLVLRGLPSGYGRTLIKKPGFCDRVAVFARQAGLQAAQIFDPGSKTGSYKFVTTTEHEKRTGDNTMTSNLLSPNQDPPEGFIWFGGIIVPAIKSILKEMEDAEEPTGLVEPVEVEGGGFKTIQWGINRASVNLFGFDALSMDDMREAIQRDTSGDWHPDDLERKRQLYRDEGSKFEQVARIRTKAGWMLVQFSSRRTGFRNLVLSRGEQASEVVASPDLILVA
jgi:hypothetical protein